MTFAQRYPHYEPRADGKLGAVGREFDARVAAMPRCRCGLLLPCNDCLPTDVATFQAERMRTGGGIEAPDAPVLTAAEMRAPRTKWLREHDEGAGYGSHRMTYGRVK